MIYCDFDKKVSMLQAKEVSKYTSLARFSKMTNELLRKHLK